ncbi:MAG: hypothetical protein PHU93_03695 [Candidatus Gracilibacteria bacterium]|nr:hypothetical protein [Candidatus Gracilibacteria bacterium]
MTDHMREMHEASGRILAQARAMDAKVAENMSCDTLVGVKNRVNGIHSASARESNEFHSRRNRDAED